MDEVLAVEDVKVGLPSCTLDAGGITVGGTDLTVVDEEATELVVVVVEELEVTLLVVLDNTVLVDVAKVVETGDEVGSEDLVEVTNVVEDLDEEIKPN